MATECAYVIFYCSDNPLFDICLHGAGVLIQKSFFAWSDYNISLLQPLSHILDLTKCKYALSAPRELSNEVTMSIVFIIL